MNFDFILRPDKELAYIKSLDDKSISRILRDKSQPVRTLEMKFNGNLPKKTD